MVFVFKKKGPGMRSRILVTLGLSVLLAAAVDGSARPARAGSATFEIEIDSAAAGLSTGAGGLMDIQLNPSTVPSSATVEAQVYGVSTDGTLGSYYGGTPTGDASGSLPGTATLFNDQLTNEVTQNFAVGSFFDVFVTLSGAEIGGTIPTPTGTVFTLSLYDPNPSDNPATLTLTVQPDGTLTPSISSPTGAGVSTLSVPEPSGALLLGAGLGALVAAGRFRTRRALG